MCLSKCKKKIRMYTHTREREWAPQEPMCKKTKMVPEEEQNPQNTPIKGVEVPLYSHNWFGFGDYDLKRKRVVFHPVPVTPTKVTEGKVVRKL